MRSNKRAKVSQELFISLFSFRFPGAQERVVIWGFITHKTLQKKSLISKTRTNFKSGISFIMLKKKMHCKSEGAQA